MSGTSLGRSYGELRFQSPRTSFEAFGRRTVRDRRHFLQVASASLGEVGYCVHAARRLGYVSDSVYAKLETEVKQVAAPLRGLIDSFDLHK
jgi:four helix bundle protein